MAINNNKEILSQYNAWPQFGIASVVLLFLYLGTGIHSDDYDFLYISMSWSHPELLSLYQANPTYLYSLPSMYFDFIQIYFFGHQDIWYDLAKTAISIFAIYSSWLFSSQYIEKQRAFLFSTLFVLYPIHDAANYWFVGTYFLMTGAWIMLAHVYINQKRYFIGVPLGFVGAFWSYASPAFVGGLSLTFLISKEYKKFLLFIIPESIYVVYYLGINKLFATGEYRTKDISNVFNLVKQFSLQVVTFLDSAIGPSFWLKVYYSILSVSWISFIVGLLAGLYCWRLFSKSKPSYNKPLLVAVSGVCLSGFLMFAITGMYPQIAFNLGNRVTYYGSFLLALLLISIPWKNTTSFVIFITISMSIAGLSEHWKDWNQRQRSAIENVRTNTELQHLQPKDVLWVSGNQYSHLGPISHIEFFSESYAIRDIISFAQEEKINYTVSSLNHRYRWENGVIKDVKYGNATLVGTTVKIYDSEKNKLLTIPSSEFNSYVDNLPLENRHWIQLVQQSWVKDAIIYLMPRLEYLFKK